MKRRGSLSILTIFIFAVPELLDLIWRKIGFLPYIFVCRMITWVVFLRMFWNFISSLPVKRGWSLSFLVGTISNVLVMKIGWTDVGSGGYILVSTAHSRGVTIHFFHKRYVSRYLICINLRYVLYENNYSLKSMLVDMGAVMFFFIWGRLRTSGNYK